MKTYQSGSVIALLLFCSNALFAQEARVQVENGWIRAVPASLTDSAAFMTLVNNGDHDLRLTGAETKVAAMVMPMTTTREMKDGVQVMGMKRVNRLVVPAHGRLVLAPGGDHLMIMSLKTHPKPGDKVTLTLRFDPGKEEVAVELPVSLTKP